MEIEKVLINRALFPRWTMILQKESQLKEFLSLHCASLYMITSLQWVLCLLQWKRDFKLVSVCWVTREMHLLTEKSIVFHMNYRRSLVWTDFIFSVKQKKKKGLFTLSLHVLKHKRHPDTREPWNICWNFSMSRRPFRQCSSILMLYWIKGLNLFCFLNQVH